jgi:superfamily II helicase
LNAVDNLTMTLDQLENKLTHITNVHQTHLEKLANELARRFHALDGDSLRPDAAARLLAQRDHVTSATIDPETAPNQALIGVHSRIADIATCGFCSYPLSRSRICLICNVVICSKCYEKKKEQTRAACAGVCRMVRFPKFDQLVKGFNDLGIFKSGYTIVEEGDEDVGFEEKTLQQIEEVWSIEGANAGVHREGSS